MQRWFLRALTWAPPALAVVFLVTLVATQGTVRESLYSHGDHASVPVIAELLGDAPEGSTVLLGNYVWSEALWLTQATGWLPNHHFIWQLIPFVMWLLTAAAVGLAVRRVADRPAALIAAALVICAGLGMRNALWSLSTHGPVAVHVALLLLGLVLAVQRPRWLRGARGYAGAVLLGLVTALGATDQLVVVGGLGPLLAAGLVLWLARGDAATMRLVALTTAIALAGAAVLNQLAEAASIVKGTTNYTFVGPDFVLHNFELLFPAIARLVAKSAYGTPMTAENALAMAAGLLAMLAAVVVLHTAVRVLKRALWPARFATAPPATGPDGTIVAVPAGPSAAWIGVVVFAVCALVANLLSWLFTNAPQDEYAGRYLIAGWLAVCVLIPVLAARLDLRWLAAATATVICLAATVDFVRSPGPAAGIGFPTDQTAGEIRKFAQQHGVTRGYASYWDAMPVSWHTRLGLKVYPVMNCLGPAWPGQNCQFYLHTISSWYAPQPGRTLLLVDPPLPYQPNLDPKYGKPIATAQFGTITAYVFRKDLAPLIGPRQQ